MIYLVAKVVIWLALAFLLGAGLGWWLRRFRSQKDAALHAGQLSSSKEQYDLLEQNSTALRKSYSDLEQRLLERSDAADNAEKIRLSVEEQLAEKEVEQTQLAGELELAANSLRKSQSELVANQSAMAQLQIQVNQERSKTEQQRDRLQKLEAQSSALSDVNAEQLAELITLRSKYEEQQAQFDSLQTEHTNQSGSMNRLRQSFSALEARLLQAQQREQTLVVHEQSAAVEVARLSSDASAAKDQVQELTQSLEHAQARLGQVDSIREEMREQQAEIERLSRDVVKWRQRIPDLQSELDEREMELRNTQERLSEVEQAARRDRTLLQQQALTAKQAVQDKDAVLTDHASLQAELSQARARLAQQAEQQQRLRGPRQNNTSVAQKDARIAQLTAKLSMLNILQSSSGAAEQTQLAATTELDVSVSSASGSRPAWLLDAAPADPDNLQRIKGIGPKLSALLNSLGLYTFEQLARLEDGDVRWLDDQLDFKGRVERDQWVAQARSLNK